MTTRVFRTRWNEEIVIPGENSSVKEITASLLVHYATNTVANLVGFENMHFQELQLLQDTSFSSFIEEINLKCVLWK